MKRLAAVMVFALWAAALAGQWQPASHDHPAHPPHAVSAAIGSGSGAMMLDHSHVGDSPASHTPDGFTAAVLPRATVTVAALSAMTFVVGCALLCGCTAVRAPRGPPDHHRIPLAGQALLLRICIARR